MGIRLEGPPIRPEKGFNIVSDGIATGAIQIPGDAQPIVLMRDRQTTGGYPKIATIISADLDRFAQLAPGSPVRFAIVSREEAVAAARSRRRWLDSLPSLLVPVDGVPLDRAPARPQPDRRRDGGVRSGQAAV